MQPNILPKDFISLGEAPMPLPTLASILVAQGDPCRVSDPTDAKPREEGPSFYGRSKFATTEQLLLGATTTTTATTSTVYQDWTNIEVFPAYQGDNGVVRWSPKFTSPTTIPPPPPVLPLGQSFPVSSGRGVVYGGRSDGSTSLSRIATTGYIHSDFAANTYSVARGSTVMGAGPGPEGHPVLLRPRQRGHRGGRQREKTPTFKSEEDRRNWEKERRKKDIHNKVEQRRRYNINDRIQDLGTLLIKGGLDIRQSKGAILREAIKYIQTLRGEEIRLRKVENLSGKLENENNKLFDKIQGIEMLLQAHGYVSTTTAIPQLYTTDDNQQPLHHPGNIASSYYAPLKEEDTPTEYYQHPRQHHHHHHC